MKKFALIGCGDISKFHAENISRVGRLVAVCDVINEKADETAKIYGSNSYNSIDDLLVAEKTVDVMAVCTPNGLHAEHIIKSLQAGKNVVTESPLCLTKAAAWQIIETEKFCRQKVFVMQPFRHNTGFQQLMNRRQEETYSDDNKMLINGVLQVSDRPLSGWRRSSFPGGGLLYVSFSNCIDVAISLFGEIETASGFVTNEKGKSPEFESSGVASLRMANGTLGGLQWSVSNDEEVGQATFAFVTQNDAFVIEVKDVEGDKLYSSFYDDLLASLDGKETNIASLFDALKTVEAIEKIYKACR